IAVLAIVPPIVKGKIDASPLNTTEDFQRSLWLMGSSLELEAEAAASSEGTHAPHATTSPTPGRPSTRDRHAAAVSRSRTAVKRNRIMATFAVLAVGFALLTLASDSAVPMALFIADCVLFFVYCLLLVLIPLISGTRRSQRLQRQPSLRRG
ncbi:MAG: hypothetical protein ACYC55_09130, partial [Candidatus Geothermincolia bacterium]